MPRGTDTLDAAAWPAAPAGAAAARSAASPDDRPVDPRYPYTLELAAGGLLSSRLSLTGTSDGGSGAAGSLRLLFLGPLAENFQGSGGVWVDTSGFVSLLGGARQLFVSEEWQTQAELAAMADVHPTFALGARLGAGVARELSPGWRAGASLGLAFLAIDVRVVVDAALTVSRSW